MGDRYELVRACVYCGKVDDEIWYAPTSGFITFKCEKCHKENFITSDLKVKKMEDMTYEDVYDAVSFTSNFMDDKQVENYAKEMFNKIKRPDPLKEIVKEKLKRIKNEHKRKNNGNNK